VPEEEGKAAESLTALREQAEESFIAAGLLSQEVRDRVTRVACGGFAFDALNSVSQFNALLRMLKSRVSSGPPEVGAERE
jgi:hypothetical protein